MTRTETLSLILGVGGAITYAMCAQASATLGDRVGARTYCVLAAISVLVALLIVGLS